MQLQAKTVVITGAARGIGRALAEEFAAHGANVALVDINAADIADTQKACSARGIRPTCASTFNGSQVLACFEPDYQQAERNGT